MFLVGSSATKVMHTFLPRKTHNIHNIIQASPNGFSRHKKPIYISAMILDPRFKTLLCKTHQEFILEHCNLSVKETIQILKVIDINISKHQEKEELAGKSSESSAPKYLCLQIKKSLKKDIKPSYIKLMPYCTPDFFMKRISSQSSDNKRSIMSERLVSEIWCFFFYKKNFFLYHCKKNLLKCLQLACRKSQKASVVTPTMLQK
ncbi:hypothetical protein VP01_910g5 [Puccinia sorghi]|uniref:Uncharacterized protein n=1 Tax=Puccinia sorghi TaxID=27349 RepID=A0A0L6U7K9_9BASI|nr:hypothetical protein VP01_910g5 [Puccinia sorghi]